MKRREKYRRSVASVAREVAAAVSDVHASSNKNEGDVGLNPSKNHSVTIWSWPKTTAVPYVIVALVSVLVYANSIHGDFVHDDLPAIVNNPDVTCNSNCDWRQVFVNDFWGKRLTDPTSHKSYRPLTVLTFR